jgi:hypothetical protein
MFTDINSEDRLVQATVAEYLEEKLGWESIFAWKQETFGLGGTLGRTDTREVVLTRDLRKALYHLNPHLPPTAIDDAVAQLTQHDFSRSLLQHNRDFYRLIREGHARPDEILALTYTDNAAGEMRTRVKAAITNQDVSKLQALTFHAYCNGLLHRTGNQFGVLDDKDLWIFLRRRIRELHLQHFVRAAKESPNPTHGHHEFGNAETYFLVGNALGEAMKKLCPKPDGK